MSGHVAPMLLVVHNIVGPVVMMLLPIPVDEHVWSQVSVCALQPSLSMPGPARSPSRSSPPAPHGKIVDGGELHVFEQSHP